MASWEGDHKYPSKDAPARQQRRPKCPICGDTDCVCPPFEHTAEHSRELAPSKCPISGDSGCVWPNFEHRRLCREIAFVIDDEPRPWCPVCGETCCVCGPFADKGFFPGMARFI